jgi:uncharacterized membrane protein
VLPIIAFARTQQLVRRLDQIEHELWQRRRGKREDTEVATLKETAEITEQIATVKPAEPRAEPTLPIETADVATPPPAPVSTVDLEAWLGARGLGWAAVVLLLFAAAFFLKVVIDRGLLDELARIGIGLAVGASLAVAGYRAERRGWRAFNQMLTAAGVVVIYLMTFGSFGFYHLLPQGRASFYLVAIVAEAFALAILYDSPTIALMGVLGGLVTPALLHTDQDRHRDLFLYLLVLDAGALGLILFRPWWASATVALLGSHLLFWAWHAEHYHPSKLAIVLTFQGAVFALFLGHTVLASVLRSRRAGIEDLVRLLVNAFLFALAGYVLLDPDHHAWLSTCAVGLAIAYALLAWLIQERRAADGPLLLAAVAVAMAFLATVFPLQAKASWIGVGWAVQGLALWWFGLRIGAAPLRGLGAVFLILGVGRLLVVDTLITPPHLEPFWPIFNSYGLPALGITACALAAATTSFRCRPVPQSADFVAMRVLGVGGVLLLWLICSIETYDYFETQVTTASPAALSRLTPREREMDPAERQRYLAERDEHLRRTAQAALSIVWAVFAASLLLVGLRLPSQPLRWLALGIFGLTLAKVMVIDIQNLAGFYRVTAFFVLSLIMGGAAWAYQKVKRALLLPEQETTR